MDTESDPPPEHLFRPAKRRKFVPRRPDESTRSAPLAQSNAAASDNNSPQPSEALSGDDAEEDQPAGVVRLRRPQATRKGGIGFSATFRSRRDDAQQGALVSAEETEKDRVQAMCDRFTSDIGQTADVDKHMMEYIDAEMAKRHQRNPPPDHTVGDSSATTQTTKGISATGQQEREPASLGKLHEIDLGQEARLRNIARTEAATRRLGGDEDSNLSEEGIAAQLNRPTTSKASRHKKRRTSADIERDRLVEEVMRESKLEVYDEPEDEVSLDDQAADDRIAEQFRRDFLDAIHSRRRAARTTRNPKTEKTEVPKGPKLGGSRSARAAMRDMQSKAGQK